MYDKITILTDPVLSFDTGVKQILKRLFIAFTNFFQKNLYRGHFAVTRSLVKGFYLNKVNFNYNPLTINGLSKCIIVLSGIETLEQSIKLKKRGIVKRIIAGPNIVEFSSDAEGILASKEIDLVLTPSFWVSQLYFQDFVELKNKCFSWPAGVDPEFWSPNNCRSMKNENKYILIYSKTKSPKTMELISKIHGFLKIEGFRVKILQYGFYNLDGYREVLCKCSLLIGFTNGSESQGIAWAEAWSMNVPTLVFQNNKQTYRGREFKCSTAPYLTNENGSFFSNYYNFKIKFLNWRNGSIKYDPRRWIDENMTDSVCALNLYKRIVND